MTHKMNNPYSAIIDKFILADFPNSKLPRNPENILELLTDAIIGSGKVRFGPKPKPESLVQIRSVISQYVASNEPIPFMVPWGSEKPDFSSVDIAEVAALKTLSCLQSRVTDHYHPGVQIALRVEDASAPYLFHDIPDTSRNAACQYTKDMFQLVRLLGLDSFIHMRPESMLVTEQEFNTEADLVLPSMESYLTHVLDGLPFMVSPKEINALGWKGEIRYDTAMFYMGQYAKLYPTKTQSERIHILARYFSSALARARLRIRGDKPEWNGQFIDLSFVQSPPGTEAYFNRRVNYRTIPEQLTSNHIPPWRAKGYLHIEDSIATPKLLSFSEFRDELDEHHFTLSDEKGEVTIRSDIFVAD